MYQLHTGESSGGRLLFVIVEIEFKENVVFLFFEEWTL